MATQGEMKMVCIGGCGAEIGTASPICAKCAKEFLDWRKTYDGKATVSDEAEQIMVSVCQGAIKSAEA